MGNITLFDTMVEAYCRKFMDLEEIIEAEIINAENELRFSTTDFERKVKTYALEKLQEKARLLEERSEGFEDAVQAMGIDIKEFHKALSKIYHG